MKIFIKDMTIEIDGKFDDVAGKYLCDVFKGAKATYTPEEKTEKKPKASSKKAEPAEEETADDGFEETTPADGVPFEAPETEEGHTKEEVRALMAKLIKTGGRSKAREILDSFGAKDLSAIPIGKYDAVYAAVKEALDA